MLWFVCRPITNQQTTEPNAANRKHVVLENFSDLVPSMEIFLICENEEMSPRATDPELQTSHCKMHHSLRVTSSDVTAALCLDPGLPSAVPTHRLLHVRFQYGFRPLLSNQSSTQIKSVFTRTDGSE